MDLRSLGDAATRHPIEEGRHQHQGNCGLGWSACSALALRAAALARRRARATPKGTGHRLVESAEENARGTGLEALYLLSIDTEAFFARLGYERIPRQSIPEAIRALPQFTSLFPDSAQCTRKLLHG